MKYPIDADRYIKTVRLLYGVNPDNEETYRRIISVANDCYAAGLMGEEGFPLDAADMFRATAENLGWPLEPVMENDTANELIPLLIEMFNRAYEQGQQDTESMLEGGESYDEES